MTASAPSTLVNVASAAHPLDAHRRSLRRVSACAATATLLAAAWAIWPLGSTAESLPPAPEIATSNAPAQRPSPLNLAAFSTPTWDAPPLPPPPPKAVAATPPPPPPPPLKLQLLGIVRDDTIDASGSPVYIAAIYDEAADRLLMLRAGDRIGAPGSSSSSPVLGPGTITRVTADAVELRDASGLRRLALRQPIAPIPGLSPASTPGSPIRREGP